MALNRTLLAALAAIALAGCATQPPRPPRPAMQPLSVAGDFGYSDRAVDDDTVEVTYRGAAIPVATDNPRTDPRIEAEKARVRDLALLHAAEIAEARGMAALLVTNEQVLSDTDVRTYPRCRIAPLWGAYPYWGFGYNRYHEWPDYYICTRVRTAKGQVTAILTVDLLQQAAEGGKTLSTAETLLRLRRTYAGATYP